MLSSPLGRVRLLAGRRASLERNKPWQSQILPQPEIYAAICRYALPWSVAAPCLVDMHECCQKERRTSAFANSQDSAHVPRLWRLFVPWGSVMRMTRGCAGVVDASPQSFGRITTPHTGVWKGRDSSRECGLFHHLFRTVYRVVSFGRTSAI